MQKLRCSHFLLRRILSEPGLDKSESVQTTHTISSCSCDESTTSAHRARGTPVGRGSQVMAILIVEAPNPWRKAPLRLPGASGQRHGASERGKAREVVRWVPGEALLTHPHLDFMTRLMREHYRQDIMYAARWKTRSWQQPAALFASSCSDLSHHVYQHPVTSPSPSF